MRNLMLGIMVFIASLAPAAAQVLTRPPADLQSIAVPVLEQVTRDYPQAWACAHVESRSCKADWINLAASALHAVDPRFGLNGKRGNPNDVSMDVITYLLHPDNPRMVAAWDVCGGCGAPGARVVWSEITNYSTIGQPGTAIWIRPAPAAGGGSGGTGTGSGGTGGPPPPAPVDLRPVLDAIASLVARVDAVEGKADAASREALLAALRALEIIDLVKRIPTDVPPPPASGRCLTGRVPKAFGGSTEVVFCPKE